MRHRLSSIIFSYVLLSAWPATADTISGGVSETDTAGQEASFRIARPLQDNVGRAEVPQAASEQPPPNAPVLHGQEQMAVLYDEHGQRLVGVLGAKVEMLRGIVLAIFPASALNQWGIHPGDRILGYNNHRWKNGWDMEKAVSAGPPGSVMQITILHDGQVISIQAPRIDPRAVIGYDRLLGTHYYENRAKEARYW